MRIGSYLGGFGGGAMGGVLYGNQDKSRTTRALMGGSFRAFYPAIGGSKEQSGHGFFGRFGLGLGFSVGGSLAGAGLGYGAAKMAARFMRR